MKLFLNPIFFKDHLQKELECENREYLKFEKLKWHLNCADIPLHQHRALPISHIDFSFSSFLSMALSKTYREDMLGQTWKEAVLGLPLLLLLGHCYTIYPPHP